MLTKLEAVNLMLEALGEDPVSSLASGLPDAEAAERILDRVSSEVQAKGWHCNTEFKYKMYTNTNGNILVPDTVLRIDTTYSHRDVNVVVREFDNTRALYDIRNQTFEFSQSYLYVDVVWKFGWSALTPELQNYIAHKAARKFQESEMGSVSLDSFTVRNEGEAWAALQDAEAAAEDTNILTQSPHARYVTYRPHRLWGT